MSDVKDAVRSRYAGVAMQLTVLQGEPGAGCCQADGPDCGCSGSYSDAELKEIGLTESVSLGCGNPTMLAQLEPGQVVLDLGSGGGIDVYDPRSPRPIAKLAGSSGHWNSPIIVDGHVLEPEGNANDRSLAGSLELFSAR